MYAFLCNLTPRSASAKMTNIYHGGLISSFRRYHGTPIPLNESLYGVVYYFHNVRTQLDADNLSKPIWDALKSVAYVDDKLIRFRSSGIFDLRGEGIDVLDLSNMPDYAIGHFLRMIERDDHVLYVEVGKFDFGLFQFGREK